VVWELLEHYRGTSLISLCLSWHWRERLLFWQPTGPNPLDHHDDKADRSRAMGVSLPFSKLPHIYLPSGTGTPQPYAESPSTCASY
jgi:hypothetical protein